MEAAVDAVIPPDSLLNFAMAKFHRGANAEVEKFRGYLHEKDRTKPKFLWMAIDAERFHTQDGLGDIKQFAVWYAGAAGK